MRKLPVSEEVYNKILLESKRSGLSPDEVAEKKLREFFGALNLLDETIRLSKEITGNAERIRDGLLSK